MGRVQRSNCACSTMCGQSQTWRSCLVSSICPRCGTSYCTKKSPGYHCNIWSQNSLDNIISKDPTKLSAHDKRSAKIVKENLNSNFEYQNWHPLKKEVITKKGRKSKIPN